MAPLAENEITDPDMRDRIERRTRLRFRNSLLDFRFGIQVDRLD